MKLELNRLHYAKEGTSNYHTDQKYSTDLQLNFLELIHQHSIAILLLDLRIFLGIELNLISSSISRLLEILASNVIFPQQVFHCHLQSSYSKLYLSATYMFYSVFCSIKISFKPYLIYMSYLINFHLTFLLVILGYKKLIYTLYHLLMTCFSSWFRV